MLTEAQIEQMRAIGLRLDRAGVFWQDGAPVTHARLRKALLSWLDVRDDGRDIVNLDGRGTPAAGSAGVGQRGPIDKRYAYVEIEDAHLRALGAHWSGDRCTIVWDDDRELELDYAHLTQAPDHALYTHVGRLRGRIAGPAYHAVAEHIVELDDGGFALAAAGQRWPIAASA